MMKSLFAGMVATLALIAATPAAATNWTFAMTGSSTTTYGSPNALSFMQTVGGVTLHVQVTAWSSTPSGTITQSYLGYYGSGLGDTDIHEGTGGGNSHTVDNIGGDYDFLVFQFDQVVKPVSATFTKFSINGSNDSDASIVFATTSAPWNSTLTPSILAASVYKGSYELSNGGTGSSINPTGYTGNLLVIGADVLDSHDLDDAFKLSNLVVASVPVPEMQSWAMLTVGLGLVGAGAARRRRAVALA